MTSEVIVMNRLGIALASDSAATVYVEGRAKVYHADKLFMLSNHHPVGAMVYNNSSLLGVPWETILKMFRAWLGARSFNTLEEYAEYLLGYLNDNDRLFPRALQMKYYLRLVRFLFEDIRDNIRQDFLTKARESTADPRAELLRATERIVQATVDEWRALQDQDANHFGTGLGATYSGQASGEISQLIAEYFESAGDEVVKGLTELARLVVDKDEILTTSLSGLVIAGFGDQQHFPVMQEYVLGEIYQGKLKFKCEKTRRIDSDTPSVISPFAQSDMVDTFLEGVSPRLAYALMEAVLKVMTGLPEEIIDGMPGVSKKKKEAHKATVRPLMRQAATKMVRQFRDHRFRKHLQPILQSIEFLPKNELAHVASSLVNLSSFQKRMSITEDETVGGPIDVAVISKGDGFVWIERKHYFRPELNRHYFEQRSAAAKQRLFGADHEKRDDEKDHEGGNTE